jgi:hypothetical protein
LHELHLALEQDAPSDWSGVSRVLQNALSIHPLVLPSLNCLEMTFPSLDLPSLKPYIAVFAPKLIERLADSKPVVRETARRVLLAAGNAAASHGVEGKECMTLLDSRIVEGFAGKNAKTREMVRLSSIFTM